MSKSWQITAVYRDLSGTLRQLTFATLDHTTLGKAIELTLAHVRSQYATGSAWAVRWE
jgi:hypothetical protein